jgi:phosphoglucomutase
VPLWLNVLAVLNKPADQIVREHWAAFGRDCYARHDYEEVDTAANDLMDALRAKLGSLPGQRFGPLKRSLQPTTSPTRTQLTAQLRQTRAFALHSSRMHGLSSVSRGQAHPVRR